MQKQQRSHPSAGHRYPVTAPMYKALRRDIERLVASNEKLSSECAANARQWDQLRLDLQDLRRLFRGI